tara:strand:- start:1704 stop:1958 length:255 start_codon:yes stop_codon:yes gene_type:complete
MKLSTNSTVDINVLKGALIINEHGAEFRCSGIGLNITQEMLAESNLEVVIQMQEYDGEGELMEGTVSVPFNNLKDWTIQLQNYD